MGCLIISNKMSRVAYMNEDSRDLSVDVELDTIADIFNGRIVVVNRNFKVIKDTFRLAEGRTHVAEEVIRCFQGESSSRLEKDKHYFASTVCWWPRLPRRILPAWRRKYPTRRRFFS